VASAFTARRWIIGHAWALTLRGMIAAEQGNIRRLAMALPPSNMRAHMDIDREYAAHQRAVMCAASATSTGERTEHLTRASTIAGKISVFQRELGAAAACRQPFLKT
jgi:hypothetical protein